MPDQIPLNDESNLVSPSHWKAVTGIGVFILVYAATGSLDHKQRAVAATFAAAVVLWITEAIPLAMTALLSTVALVVTGALPTKDAFGAYGDQIILLFVGSFILAKSMENSGLDRRLALTILSKKWATKSGSAILLALGSIACFISLFVSNTATTAMMLPIGITLLKSLNQERRGSPYAISFMLMLTWGSSVAVGTIIGTPPNVLGVGLIRQTTGVNINFIQWAAFAMPITLCMLAFAWLMLRPRGVDAEIDTRSAKDHASEELAILGPLRDSERISLLGFAIAIALWLIPGIVEYAAGSGTPTAKLWSDRVPEAVAAIIGASVLFVMPCRDKASNRAMTWAAATKIEWGTILLFAGGLALGKAAFDSGLAKLIGESAATALGAKDVWTITALAVAMSIILSELASNTASANVMVPVAMAIATGAGVNPIPAALGAVIGANLGFMLPISTAPNAVIYSTGLVPARTMMAKGLAFDIAGFFVTMICLRLILPLLNLA